jgi:hypothetical protein
VVAADLIHSMAVERLVERANAGQKNSADDCRVWHDGRAHLDWHERHVWLALVWAGHQQPSWCPSVFGIRAMRERNAGNHADKTSPGCSMGCRGWGESGGTYPLPLLETDFRDAQPIDFAGGFFIPFLTLWWTPLFATHDEVSIAAKDTARNSFQVQATRVASSGTGKFTVHVVPLSDRTLIAPSTCSTKRRTRPIPRRLVSTST